MIEFNYPFLELREDARLTAQPSPAVLGDAFSEERRARCVQSLVFMFLLQTHRDTAPLPLPSALQTLLGGEPESQAVNPNH